MIEKAIFARLSAVAGLTALVSTRIYNEVIAQGAAYPCLAFTTVSTQRFPAMGANITLAKSRVQVNCYGATKLSAADVAVQVRAALSRWGGTAGGVVVQSIFDETQTSDYDDAIQKHRVIVEFMAWHEE